MWNLLRKRWTTGSAPFPTSWRSLRWPCRSSASGCTLRCVDTVAHRPKYQKVQWSFLNSLSIYSLSIWYLVVCGHYVINCKIFEISVLPNVVHWWHLIPSFSLRTFSLVRIYGNSCQRSRLTLMGSMRAGRLVVCVCVFKNFFENCSLETISATPSYHISTTSKVSEDIKTKLRSHN